MLINKISDEPSKNFADLSIDNSRGLFPLDICNIAHKILPSAKIPNKTEDIKAIRYEKNKIEKFSL